jgi:hypothetical protein
MKGIWEKCGKLNPFFIVRYFNFRIYFIWHVGEKKVIEEQGGLAGWANL